MVVAIVQFLSHCLIRNIDKNSFDVFDHPPLFSTHGDCTRCWRCRQDVKVVNDPYDIRNLVYIDDGPYSIKSSGS